MSRVETFHHRRSNLNSLRISRPCHLGIMKVLVQTQGYLTIVANHRTANQAKIYAISTCKLCQIWVILWSLLPPSLLHIVFANSESVFLQAQCACILLNLNILKNSHFADVVIWLYHQNCVIEINSLNM